MSLIICGVKPAVERADAVFLFVAVCDECGDTHSFECCPECGAWIIPSLGLLGLTWYCEEFCGWSKVTEPFPEDE